MLLGIQMDDEGYVQTHQHFSRAHDPHWPFPLWTQSDNHPNRVKDKTFGWHFQPLDKAPGWVEDALRHWGRCRRSSRPGGPRRMPSTPRICNCGGLVRVVRRTVPCRTWSGSAKETPGSGRTGGSALLLRRRPCPAIASIRPQLPEACPRSGIEDLLYHNTPLDVAVSPDQVEITVRDRPLGPLRIALKDNRQENATGQTVSSFSLDAAENYRFTRMR